MGRFVYLLMASFAADITVSIRRGVSEQLLIPVNLLDLGLGICVLDGLVSSCVVFCADVFCSAPE